MLQARDLLNDQVTVQPLKVWHPSRLKTGLRNHSIGRKISIKTEHPARFCTRSPSVYPPLRCCATISSTGYGCFCLEQVDLGPQVLTILNGVLHYSPRPGAIFLVIARPLVHDVMPALIPGRIFIIQPYKPFRDGRECAESSSLRKIEDNYRLPWIIFIYKF